jgi:hypothetical protein
MTKTAPDEEKKLMNTVRINFFQILEMALCGIYIFTTREWFFQ